MGASGVKLQGPARRSKALAAYKYALERVTYGEIGERLGVSRSLASTLVAEEQERQWAGRSLDDAKQEKQRAIGTYESVIRASWQRMARMHPSSLNVSGCLNTIISAQKAVDEITGAKAPARSENRSDLHFHDDSRSLEDYFAELDQFRAGHGETGVAEPLDSPEANC